MGLLILHHLALLKVCQMVDWIVYLKAQILVLYLEIGLCLALHLVLCLGEHFHLGSQLGKRLESNLEKQMDCHLGCHLRTHWDVKMEFEMD
jgi:hypothetical protein